MFSRDFEGRFELWEPSHIAVMVALALLWVVVPLVFRPLKDTSADTCFRYTLAAVLVLQYLGWMLWEAAVGRFTLQLSLPLNLCDLSNFLVAYLLVSRSYRLFEVLYFWALAGTIQSYITPNIYYGFPHLEFFVFYLQHGGEVLAILYLTFVHGMRPRAISMLKAFGWLGLFVAAVYVIDLALDANYMFLMADTPQPSTVTKMIALIGYPPLHIVGLAGVSAVSILVLYSPFAVANLYRKVASET